MAKQQQGVEEVVRGVLAAATCSVEELARSAGLSAFSLWSWAAGRRNPSPENLEKLATVLERKGGELVSLAAELRRAVED